MSVQIFRLRPIATALLLATCLPAPALADDADFVTPSVTAVQRTRERAMSNGALGVNAFRVHDLGFIGTGVRVNVLDTGVRATHRELGARVLRTQSRDVSTSTGRSSTGITDGHGHGTFVASIIAGAADGYGFTGVAPGASIISSEVMSAATGWGGSDAALLRAVRNGISGGAFIHNMSLGAGGPIGEAALREAVARGTLSIVAAGNRGVANPDWPARYAKETWANNSIIAVGAVDSRNNIASFSNRAGDTANWYVVALGVDVVGAGASSNTAYVSGSGTSMATPIVAGVAALIKERWTRLNASQVGQIIFATTTDLGAPGIDPVYGRGLVDAYRAMQPVGTTGTRTANGQWSFNTGGTLLTASGTWNTRAMGAASTLSGVLVFDSFDRDFATDFSSALVTPRPVGFEGLAPLSDRQMQFAEKTLDPMGSRMLLASETRLDRMRADGGEQQTLGNYVHRFRGTNAVLGAAWVQKFEGGTQFGFGSGGMNAFFGLQGMDSVSTQQTAQGLQNPMFALVPMAQSVGLALPVAQTWEMKLGLASSHGGNAVAEQLGITGGMALKQTLALAELNRRFDEGRTVIGLQVANLSENGSLAGGQGYGLLSLQEMRTSTQALTLQAATRLSEHLVAGAQFTTAYLPAAGNGGASLVTGATSMNLSGWGVGLTRFDAFTKGDRLALTLSEPLAVRSGSLLLDVPTTVDGNGSIGYERRSLGLAGSARERLYEATWSMPLDKGTASLMVSGMYRQHALGNADASGELLGMLRFQRVF